MTRIGLELNHVLRNVNKQIIKYYVKTRSALCDFEEDDADDRLDVFENYAKFQSKKDKSNFLFVDYPYEIFGCANTMEKNLMAVLTVWLEELENIEDDDYELVIYGLNEVGLSIQSTYFFLSKIGCRARKVVFPQSIDELWNECDVVITANADVLDNIKEGKKAVCINRPFNEGYRDKAIACYDDLSELLKDNDFFKKIKA